MNISKATTMERTKYLVTAGMLLAIGVTMPYMFHFAGEQAGKMFLPLFWAVGAAALILPMKYAILVAILLPIISNLTSAMPAVPLLYFMLIELVVYVMIASVLSNKLNPFISIGCAIACSRCVYIGSVTLAAEVLGLPAPYQTLAILVSSVLVSAPGIVLQIIIIPIIYKVFRKINNEQ